MYIMYVLVQSTYIHELQVCKQQQAASGIVSFSGSGLGTLVRHITLMSKPQLLVL